MPAVAVVLIGHGCLTPCSIVDAIIDAGFTDAALIGDDGAERNVAEGAWVDVAVDVFMDDAHGVVGWYLLGDAVDGNA